MEQRKRQPSAVKRQQVHCQIATIPGRKKTLIQAIESLLPQVDSITLVFNGFSLPSGMSDYLITFGDKIDCWQFDKKPHFDGWKFYQANRHDGYILICDDDLVYPPDFAERMVAKCREYKNKTVVSIMGKIYSHFPVKSYYHDIDINLKATGEIPLDFIVQVPGTCGLCYHSKLLPELDETAFTGINADVYLAKYLKEKGILSVVTKHEEGWVKSTFEELGPGAESVFSMNKATDRKLTEMLNNIIL